MSKLNRRTVLRGIVGGAAVNVALPLFNCMLNTNGTALADGKPMPIRFGTWGWGLGMNQSIFVPKKYGEDFDLPELGPARVAAATIPEAPQPGQRRVGPKGTTSEHLRGERERILEALRACNWNRVKAAELTGIPRRTFYRRLREYGIQ